MANERAVDLDHLDRYTGGDRGINLEILQLFDTQCGEMLNKLEALAGEGGVGKSWRELTHTLKGAARGIGAFALADIAAEAEKAGDDRRAVVEIVQRLKKTAADVQQFIEAFQKAAE